MPDDPFEQRPIEMVRTTLSLPRGLKSFARQQGKRVIPRLGLQDIIIEALKAYLPGYDPARDADYAAAYEAQETDEE